MSSAKKASTKILFDFGTLAPKSCQLWLDFLTIRHKTFEYGVRIQRVEEGPHFRSMVEIDLPFKEVRYDFDQIIDGDDFVLVSRLVMPPTNRQPARVEVVYAGLTPGMSRLLRAGKWPLYFTQVAEELRFAVKLLGAFKRDPNRALISADRAVELLLRNTLKENSARFPTLLEKAEKQFGICRSDLLILKEAHRKRNRCQHAAECCSFSDAVRYLHVIGETFRCLAEHQLATNGAMQKKDVF